MRATRTALAVSTLALALTACGQASSTTPQAQGDDPGGGSSERATAGAATEERITPAGVAAVVQEHLGPKAVRQFITYEQEPGSVSVMVRLRDATPHNFAVQVYSPEQAEMYGESGACPGTRGTDRGFRCRTLEDGTTLTMIEDAHGFSDDNAKGMVLSGSTITPDDGGALVMYESYDDSPSVSAADLERLITDPRLTWRTDPAVNEAGADIRLKEVTG